MNLRRRSTRASALTALTAFSAAALAMAGCSTGPTGADDSGELTGATTKVESGAYPVTIKDSLGSVTIKSEPKRVATLGWSDQDAALALGVDPVGAVKITWGGNANGSTPWFDAALKKLGGDRPARYSDADGIPFNDIAKVSPDLILATSAGLTEAEYKRLSKIAPVVAQPGAPWGTSWQDTTEMVGKALGRPAAAEGLVDKVEGELDDFEDAHPALDDATFVFATFDLNDTSQIGYYTPIDNRPRMLEDLGMEEAPFVERQTKDSGQFWLQVSSERAAQIDSDVVVTYDEGGKEHAKVLAQPLWKQMPALKAGNVVFLADKQKSLTMSAPSVLAMPYYLKTIAPEVAAAAKRARAGA